MVSRFFSLLFGVFFATLDFDQLWNFQKPAETEQKFRDLLPQLERSGDVDRFLQLRTQIARTQGLQRKFDEAHQTLNEVEKKLNSTTPIAEIRYFLERGRVFNSSHKKEEALPLFKKAFDRAKVRQQDNFAVDAAHMMGIAEASSEKQVEWNLLAISIAEKSKDTKAKNWLGTLYNNMGWTYHDARKYDLALDLFQKALAFREEKKDPVTIRIARWSVARAYRSLRRYEDALKIQLELEKEYAKLIQKDGYVFEELAEIYLAQGKTSLSQKYFALAYHELAKDEWFKANESTRLQRIKELGLVP